MKKQTAYEMGKQARKEGRSSSNNPFIKRKPNYIKSAYYRWELGWKDEDKYIFTLNDNPTARITFDRLFSKKQMRAYVRPLFIGCIAFGYVAAEQVEEYLDETFGKDTR